MSTRSLRLTAALVAAAAVVACSPTLETHGHILRDPAVKQLQPGVQTREDIVRLLGSPSSKAPFDENTWYYIGHKTESVAFFKPDITEQNVLVLRFDESGTLQSAGKVSPESGKEVAFVERETPTAGHELGFMEQLLGNLGRFNAPSGGFGRGGRGGGPGGPAGGF